MPTPNPPQSLFRYESFCVQSIQNLKSQVIYFADPKVFNDAFDCRLPIQMQPLTDDDIREVKVAWSKDQRRPQSDREMIRKMDVRGAGERLTTSLSETIEQNRQRYMQTTGVACFTERNDSLLMWGHYGGRYAGFCLEFDTQYDPLRKLQKVTYSDDIPLVQSKAGLLASGEDGYDDIAEQVMKIYTTKAMDWRYEAEWRAMHVNSGQAYHYESAALKAIYFGPEMPMVHKEIIFLIMRGQNRDVRFFDGSRSPDKFKVEFGPVGYTTFLESQGLA